MQKEEGRRGRGTGVREKEEKEEAGKNKRKRKSRESRRRSRKGMCKEEYLQHRTLAAKRRNYRKEKRCAVRIE